MTYNFGGLVVCSSNMFVKKKKIELMILWLKIATTKNIWVYVTYSQKPMQRSPMTKEISLQSDKYI